MVLNDVIDVVCTKEFVMLKENIENEGHILKCEQIKGLPKNDTAFI